jgi:hypothetical protein
VSPPAKVPASLFVEALVAGFPASKRESRWMLMLQACIDDSGSHSQSPIFALGGLLSNVEQWKYFADAWQAKLETDPAIDYFKMSEAMTLSGQFEGFPAPIRDQKVYELASLAVFHVQARIEVVMRWDLFNSYLKPYYESPFIPCFEATTNY